MGSLSSSLSLYDSYDLLFIPLPVMVSIIYYSQNWTKVKKPWPVSQSVPWPVGRWSHAASHITGPVFVISGGCGVGSTLSDMWLYDSTNQWIKVFHNVQLV